MRLGTAGWLLALALLAPGARADDADAAFDGLLRRNVDDLGRVAYRDLAARDGAILDAYLQALAIADPSRLGQQEQIAFWINAYNAHVLRGVLDGYDADGLIARKRFFSYYAFPLAGKERTLDEIEHEILRKQFREPRIHFALVCASTSCPKLRREAYRGAHLGAQLDDQAQGFLDDSSRNRFGPGDQVALSSIFKWFADDFVRAAGSVPAFIRRYRRLPKQPEIAYIDYDWTLNAQPEQRPE